MRKTFVFASAILGAAALAPQAMAAPEAAATKAQCESLWTQALAGSSGDLSMDKAKPFVKDFTAIDKNKDGKLSQIEWMDGCGDRLIYSKASSGSASTGAGAGTSDRTPSESSSPDKPTPSRPY